MLRTIGRSCRPCGWSGTTLLRVFSHGARSRSRFGEVHVHDLTRHTVRQWATESTPPGVIRAHPVPWKRQGSDVEVAMTEQDVGPIDYLVLEFPNGAS